jgi:hypothetical protein
MSDNRIITVRIKPPSIPNPLNIRNASSKTSYALIASKYVVRKMSFHLKGEGGNFFYLP